MGLLDKAQRLQSENPDEQKTPSESLGSAVQGLRARAETLRAREVQDPARLQPQANSGVQVHGLLARAERLRASTQSGGSAPQSPEASSPQPSPRIEDLFSSEGADAETLSDEILDALLPDHEFESSGQTGLTAELAGDHTQASQAAQADGSASAGGLLARAAAMQAEADSELTDSASDPDDFDQPGSMPTESGVMPEIEFDPDTLDSMDHDADLDELDFESADSADIHSPPDDADLLGPEGAGQVQLANELEDDFDDLPDLAFQTEPQESQSEDAHDHQGLQYAGNSDPSSDPALDHETDRSGPYDPFQRWEQEARQDAEQEIKALVGESQSDTASPQEQEYLFDEDSDYSTNPAEAHIASQKKIDHYLSLFDITKEISLVENFEDLWDNLLYALMGEVGAESICIFSASTEIRRDMPFEPVSWSGMQVDESWILGARNSIYQKVKTSDGIVYADELLQGVAGLSGLDQEILSQTQARLIIPLKNMERLYGIVLLGRQIDDQEYTLDDLEFLRLLGEIASVGIDRVSARRKFEQDTSELRRRNDIHARMFQLARQVSMQKNLDDVYDVVATHLREDFGINSWSIVLLTPRDSMYRIFAGNKISPLSIEKFKLATDTDLIARVSNLVRVYELGDFRDNSEILANYTNDDIALMRHYWIVPLINLNWLVGFISIHETDRSWSALDRELIVSLAEVCAPVFANSIILSERESLFRDPFSPLEQRLQKELQKSREYQSAVSLVDFRVRNIKRLIDVSTPEQISEFLLNLGKSIASFLAVHDFMARVGQGNFALVLPGRSRQEAALFIKKLKGELRRMRFLPGSPLDVSYSHNLISAPKDTTDAGKMLSILE
ncbi:MAG: diguanylate cyclase [Leptospiraceae bacterium]|nr:diguanylate cyclase [Leptospiraceae bacterium]